MERTKAYRSILKLEGSASVCSAVFLLGMLFQDNYAGILVAFSILGRRRMSFIGVFAIVVFVLCGFVLIGFFALPLLPVMMENCAEVTHPLSEELTVGMYVD